MIKETYPEQIGPYKITGILGKGGMGAVYRGHKPPLTRQVAIKIIKAEFINSPGALERFRREAELAADLKHPNIVTVYDYEEVSGGDSYIVTELIEGGVTLRDKLNQGKLSYREISDVLRQIASALDYAYETRHIVHRDVKPSNVFIEGNKRVALGDFGIAKDVSRNTQLTSMGEGVGTPDYMSPEQALGEQLDRRSDVYSLGVILFEMLSGKLPFPGDTPISVVMGHIQKAVPSLRGLDPNIPASIEEVVRKAMAKKPEDRFATAGDFAKAFASAIEKANQEAGQTVNLTSPSTPAMPNRPNPTPMPTSQSANTSSQQLNAVTALETQSRFQEAFNLLHQLRQQNPSDQTITNRFNRYVSQGYVYTGGYTPMPQPTPPPVPVTQMVNQYVGPQMMAMGTPPKQKSSITGWVIGGAIFLVALITSVIIIVAVVRSDPLPTDNPNRVIPIDRRQTIRADLAVTPTNPPTPTVAGVTAPAFTPTPTIAGNNPQSLAAALNADAEKLIDDNNPTGAIEKLLEAVKLDPNKALYHDNLARAYLAYYNPEKAEASARIAVKLEPNNARYRNNLGAALGNGGKYEEALKEYQAAIKITDKVALYHRNVSSTYRDMGKYKEAEAPALKAIELDGKDAKNFNMLGLVKQDLNQLPDAEKAYAKAFELDPKSHIYANNLAGVQYTQGKYPEAEQNARKSIALNEQYDLAHYNLAITLRAQGKFSDALISIRRAVEIDSDNEYNVQELASILNALKQYEEAEKVAQRAIQLSPDNARSNSILGSILYNQGKYQASLPFHLKSTQLNEYNATYFAFLGDNFAKLNDYVKARTAYNKALELEPKNKIALDGLEAIKDKK
jgi:serine/threonine protein kinase/Flp pilus assembly protein TadD